MPISVKNLKYVYSPGMPDETVAISDVSFDVADGEILGVIGHTGSGKSTLLQHLNGLIKPTSGEIYIDGQCITDGKVKMTDIRRKVGLVFQYPEYQLFEETVRLDVAFGPKNLGMDEEEREKRVRHAVELVGLDYDEIKDMSPFELSGGMKRRVAIAGVIAMDPECVVFDEPTAMLDPKGRKEIMSIIRTLHSQGRTVILITHFMEEAAEADRIIIMHNGKVEADASPAEIFSRKDLGVLEQPFAVRLAKRLRENGIDVPADIVTDVQLAEYLCKLK